MLPAISPALFNAAPPDEVTRVRPCEALDVNSDVDSLAFVAVLAVAFAASDVVEADRNEAVLRVTNRWCRSTNLEGAIDMFRTQSQVPMPYTGLTDERVMLS